MRFVKVGAAALFMALVAVDQAVAGFFQVFIDPTPPGRPVPPVPAPEIDGAGSIAVIALLASIAAVLVNKYRNR